MTDLTEQWKKGELPEGWYFVILNNGKVDIAKCSNLFINCGRKLKRDFAINNVAEVIEPICYEKWQAVNQNMDSVMRTNQALCQKLTQLKEVLKECREFFYENLIDTEFHFSCGLGSNIKKQSCIRSLSNLKTKINQVLGEDK